MRDEARDAPSKESHHSHLPFRRRDDGVRVGQLEPRFKTAGFVEGLGCVVVHFRDEPLSLRRVLPVFQATLVCEAIKRDTNVMVGSRRNNDRSPMVAGEFLDRLEHSREPFSIFLVATRLDVSRHDRSYFGGRGVHGERLDLERRLTNLIHFFRGDEVFCAAFKAEIIGSNSG
jgi:hypothetical protein